MFGHWVGRAIALVLLTIVNLFVFTPVAFFMWLFRYDALAPGVRRDASSFWHGHSGRALPKHQFADERTLFAPVGATHAPRRPVLRIATVVGVVALILLADLGAGWVYDEVSSETHGTAAVADDTFDPPNEPALRDSPWAAEVLAEQASLPSVADPYLGYRFGNKAIDLHQPRRRRAHELPVAGSGEEGVGVVLRRVRRSSATVSVTITPSRRSSRGSPRPTASRSRCATTAVPASPCGRSSSCSSRLVAAGQKPDLVVFYDGFNDLAWQMNLDLSAEPTNVYDRARSPRAPTPAPTGPTPPPTPATRRRRGAARRWRDVADAYWDQSASHHVYDALHDLIAGSDEHEGGVRQGRRPNGCPRRRRSRSPRRRGTRSRSRSRAATLASAVASSVGADASFFWQPDGVHQEAAARRGAATAPSTPTNRRAGTLRPSRRASSSPSTPFVDLGGALDAATTPVLWDFVHTNEEGARLAAAALYSHLLPQLRPASQAAAGQ